MDIDLNSNFNANEKLIPLIEDKKINNDLSIEKEIFNNFEIKNQTILPSEKIEFIKYMNKIELEVLNKPKNKFSKPSFFKMKADLENLSKNSQGFKTIKNNIKKKKSNKKKLESKDKKLK